MINFIKKQLDIKAVQTAFVFAVMYYLLFNTAIFWHKFAYSKANILAFVFDSVKDSLYLLITLFIIFFGLLVHRTLFVFGSIFLFVTGAVASYYLFFFSISPTLSIMPSIFGTHMQEAKELIGVRIIIWVVFSFLICIYSIRHFDISTTKSFTTRFLSAICLLIALNNIISPKFSFLKSYFPTQYLHNSYVYFFGKSAKFTKEDISKKYDFEHASDDDLIGVLIIGESARYQNFSINGYHRDTNPELSNMDVISYKAIACADNTYMSVPCMLSRFGAKDLELVDQETTMLSVLTKLGFDTAWFGTQSITQNYRNKPGGSFYDEVNFHIIPGGSLVFFPNDLDSKMLPYLEKNISNDGKKFIVLHTTGSHWNYSARYPKEFEKFTPIVKYASGIDPSSCSKEELVNSYDNSILYTDFFLSSVINKLKDKNAFLIYASDHGESLGENGVLTHASGRNIKEQMEIPFIIWASESYKDKYPEKWSAALSKKDIELSHDNIFHSVLDCLNINSECIDESLSVCSP